MHRPADGSNDERDGASLVDRCAAEIAEQVRRDHEDCNAGDARKECEGQAKGEALRAENENLRQRHETGNGGQNNRGDARGNALLGPEEEAVVDDKDEERKQECGKPLARRRPALAVRTAQRKTSRPAARNRMAQKRTAGTR